MSPMNCGAAAGWSWAISDGEPLTVSPCCDTNTHGVPAARPAGSVIIESINHWSIITKPMWLITTQFLVRQQGSSSSIPRLRSCECISSRNLQFNFFVTEPFCTDPDQSWSLTTNQSNQCNKHCDPIPTQLVLRSPNTIQTTFIKVSRSRFSLLLVTNKIEGLMVVLLLPGTKWQLKARRCVWWYRIGYGFGDVGAQLYQRKAKPNLVTQRMQGHNFGWFYCH